MSKEELEMQAILDKLLDQGKIIISGFTSRGEAQYRTKEHATPEMIESSDHYLKLIRSSAKLRN